MATINIPNDFIGKRQVERENRFEKNNEIRQTVQKERDEAKAKRAGQRVQGNTGGQTQSQAQAASNTGATSNAFKVSFTTANQQKRIATNFDNQKNGTNAAAKSPNAGRLAELRKQSDDIFARHADDAKTDNLNSINTEA